MKVRDICQAVEEFAPPGLAYEGDHHGLCIGHPDWEATRVLVALTVTSEVVRAAIRKHAEMIITHHPLIWEPLPALRLDVPHTRLCVELAQARIACFAAHTNLDVAPGGVNDTLAGKLDLVERRPLFPVQQAGLVKLVTFVPETHLAAVRNAVCRAGAGVIGDYTHCTFSTPGTGTFLPGEAAVPYSGKNQRVNEEPERRFETLVTKSRLSHVLEALLAAHPYEEVAYDVVTLENRDPRVGLGVRGRIPAPMSLRSFAVRVRKVLEVTRVRVVGTPEKAVRNVAVLGGAGGGHVSRVPPDVDVLVTGDVGYHDALNAQQRGLALVDAGHAGTEKCIVPVLARYLKKRLKGLRVISCDVSDPFVTL